MLDIKKKLAKRRPKFLRQDAHKKVKVPNKWRRPRGLHSKMRLEKKGYRRVLKVGFRSPKKLRGFIGDKETKLVRNLDDLKGLKPEVSIIIGSSVGLKKKLEIIKATKNEVLNIDKDKLLAKDAQRKSVKDKKDKKIKERQAKKDKKDKKTVDDKVKKDDEEKKTEEKKELDKVLTKKNNA